MHCSAIFWFITFFKLSFTGSHSKFICIQKIPLLQFEKQCETAYTMSYKGTQLQRMTPLLFVLAYHLHYVSCKRTVRAVTCRHSSSSLSSQFFSPVVDLLLVLKCPVWFGLYSTHLDNTLSVDHVHSMLVCLVFCFCSSAVLTSHKHSFVSWCTC